jgi:hypothetical protein
MRNDDDFCPIQPGIDRGRQAAKPDVVHSTSETTIDVQTSVGLVRITTTITTTIIVIEAADERDNPSVDSGIWQPATPLTLPSPARRRKR